MTPRDRTHSPVLPPDHDPSAPTANAVVLSEQIGADEPSLPTLVEAPPVKTRAPSKTDRDVAELIKLGEAQCTQAEAAAILQLTPDDFSPGSKPGIRRRRALQKGRSRGLSALRAAQLELAKTSAPMAIFLGRVYLGQSERREADCGEPNEVAEVAQAVRDRLAALVVDASRYRAAQRDREL